MLRFQILWVESCMQISSPAYVLQDSPVLSSLNLNTLTFLVNKYCRIFLYLLVSNSNSTTSRVHSMKPLLLCQPHFDEEVKKVKLCPCARPTVIRVGVNEGADKLGTGKK